MTGRRRVSASHGALAIVLALLTACASLEPIFLPDQRTSPAATNGVLGALGRRYPENWQIPLNEGPTALAWRLRAIDSATESIDLQSFIWSFDTAGSAVHDRLIAAADRGVSVRILIDDSFLIGEDPKLLELNRHENIQYRVYNPYKRRPTSGLSRTVLNLSDFGRLDHRMHNKSMVVDNRVAILGGRNLADEYFGFDGKANFRDMELLLGGPVVGEIATAFDAYFNDHWSFPIDQISHLQLSAADRAKGAGGVQALGALYAPEDEETLRDRWFAAVREAHRGRPRLFVDQPPARNPDDLADRPVQVAAQLAEVVSGAREEIVIVAAYLIPTPLASGLLKQAVDRGVRVRLLTNSINSNNHLSAYAAYRGHVRELLSFGASVHEVRIEAPSRTFYIVPPLDGKTLGLHAKYMIVDGRRVFVGSSNLDPRSLRINTEIGVLVESRSLARALLDLTEPDFDRSNAWELGLDEAGGIVWTGDDVRLTSEPARSTFQRLEEWFFAGLPIEPEL